MNQLIAGLPRKDRLHLCASAQSFELIASEILVHRGQVTRYVYFPLEGCISLLAQVDKHPGLEVGMIGPEGVLGAQLALGVSLEPLQAQVQSPGHALRIEAELFATELSLSGALRLTIGRYLNVVIDQLARSSACQRFHPIIPRLARWMLMIEDRSRVNHFHVTQQLMAYMLGVRRVGVTQAAGALQRGGLIVYHRGEIEILNRAGLEAVACSCYAFDREVYARFLSGKVVPRVGGTKRVPPFRA